MISVLCPTRGRPESMRKSAASLLDRANGPVEILTYVDDDDPMLERYGTPTIVGPRFGYLGLHRYVNALADVAQGEWLFLWNDDARMLTSGWDEIVAGHQPAVLSPMSNHNGRQMDGCVFPIVPTDWVRRVGHFSLNAHNDTWWGQIGKVLDRLVDLDDVLVLHDRIDLTGGHNDQTAAERRYDREGFFSEAMQDAIRRDVEMLRCMLAG